MKALSVKKTKKSNLLIYIFKLETNIISRLKKRGLSINPDIHHSKVPSSDLLNTRNLLQNLTVYITSTQFYINISRQEYQLELRSQSTHFSFVIVPLSSFLF